MKIYPQEKEERLELALVNYGRLPLLILDLCHPIYPPGRSGWMCQV